MLVVLLTMLAAPVAPVVLLTMLAAPVAPLEVDWQAPASCPDGDAFRARIDAQIETDAPPPALRIIGVVDEESSGRWSLDLDMHGPGWTDRRTVRGESCEAVTDAGALIVALRWVESASQPEPSPNDPPVTPPLLPALPAPPPPNEQPARPPVAVAPQALPAAAVPEPVASAAARPVVVAWVAAAGGLAVGVLPAVGGAASVDGGVEGDRWRVGISARLLPVRIADPKPGSPAGGRFDLATGGLHGCGLPSAARWFFPICGRVDVGGLRGVGRDSVAQTRSVWRAWVGVGASVAAAWRLRSWVAPFVAAEGTVGLLRPGYSVGGVSGTFFAAGRLGFRGWTGVEFRLKRLGPRPKKGPQKR